MMMQILYWREPFWLLLIALPFIIYLVLKARLYFVLTKKFDQNLLPWIDNQTGRKYKRFSRILLLLAWSFWVVALAGPRTAKYIPPEYQPEPENVNIIIDFSASMHAQDILSEDRPVSRLQAVQQQVRNWLDDAPAHLQAGITGFAGKAHILVPPTTDHAYLLHFIEYLDQLQLPLLGNNMADALSLAAAENQASPVFNHLVIFSDGDLDESSKQAALSAMSLMNTDNRSVSCIGVGGLEAVRIPVGESRYMQSSGKAVLTRQDSAWIKSLCSAPGARYADANDLASLRLTDFLQLQSPRIRADDYAAVLWNEWFGIALLAGTVFFLLALQAAKQPARRQLQKTPG